MFTRNRSVFGLVGWVMLGNLFMPGNVAAQQPLQAQRAALIRFDEPIGALSEQYLYRKLDQAEDENVDLVIIEIESPGGGLRETERIAEKLRDLPWADTVAYVPKQALSGAAIFSLGCDEIVMGPNAVFGDAGPIFMNEGLMFEHAPEKIRSDLARKVRDLAESGGRPTALAEAMVDMDLVVFKVKHKDTGKTAFKSQSEINSSENPDLWEKLNPVHETREKHFFEVNGRRAVELTVADAVVNSREDIKDRYGLQTEIIVLEKTRLDTVVVVLNNRLATGALFVVGLVALYVEFMAPGIGIGGLVSTLCFTLFFWSRFLGGTGEWLEVVMFVAGIMLMAVELFVLPGFGIWGLSGLLLMTAGLVLASESFFIPHNTLETSSLLKTTAVVVASGAIFLVSAMSLTTYLGRLPILGRLTLAPPANDDQASRETTTLPLDENVHGLSVGDVGIAGSALRPSGKAQFGNNCVDVLTEGAFVNSETNVRIVKLQGNHVVVRPVV